MREYNYNKEIRILITQVLDALGNLVIKRVNENSGLAEDNIHVNLRYSPKSRTIHDIVNKSQHITLPVMAVSIGGISYDSKRTFNKIAGFYSDSPQSTAYAHHYQPLPINLNLNLSILARYQNDIDQILTCMLNSFHPYIVISYIHPEVNEEVRCVVQWNGDVAMQYPNDIGNNQAYRIAADITFTVGGWIYRNTNSLAGKIYKIDHRFQAVSAIEGYSGMNSYRTEFNTDFWVISARPQPTKLEPYTALGGLSGQTFYVMGTMLGFTSAVALSATGGVYPSSYTIDYFADNPKLSATYPAFQGVTTNEFSILSDNLVSFTIPTPEDVNGYIAVILMNEAGYGNITIDSVRPTFNPYPSSMPEYLTYVEPQFPWVSGIWLRSDPN